MSLNADSSESNSDSGISDRWRELNAEIRKVRMKAARSLRSKRNTAWLWMRYRISWKPSRAPAGLMGRISFTAHHSSAEARAQPVLRAQYPWTLSPAILPKCCASLVTTASFDSSAVAAIHRSLSPHRSPDARIAREITPYRPPIDLVTSTTR